MATEATRHWSDGQIRLFVKDVRKRCGDAWGWMVLDVKTAMIAEKALSVIRGQARETVEIAAIDELFHGMVEAAGIDEDRTPETSP